MSGSLIGRIASGDSANSGTAAAPAAWPQDYVADASGRTWYVSPSGSDSAAGSSSAPFATPGHAVTVVAPGDTILLANGTYMGPTSMTRSGASGRYITLRAANPGMAKLVVGSGRYSALALIGVGWVRVEGLDVQADNDHGIQAEHCHHIQVVGNTCHDCGGSGIALNGGDYYLVEANSVFRNTGTNTYQTSGISVYQARAYDAVDGFHILIRRNMVYDNIESTAITAVHTEGNGIILDDYHNSQGGSTSGNYAGKTLVENNIVAFNGGCGILTYESDSVTVRHNTVAFNNTDSLNIGTWRGEISNSQGRNNHWYNNIAVCSTATNPNNNALLDGVTAGFQNTGAEWAGNLLFDANAPTRAAVLIAGASNTLSTSEALANNPLRLNPKFIQAPVGGDAGTFRVASNSPAVNSALPQHANGLDYANSPRDRHPDVGALEAPISRRCAICATFLLLE
jgi:parallel beta-helix repeat protein